MDNLKKIKFTELNPSQMKQVQGGNWVDDVVKVIDAIGPTVAKIITGVTGSNGGNATP